MEKVHELNNSEYKPSSESYSISQLIDLKTYVYVYVFVTKTKTPATRQNRHLVREHP